MSWHLAWNFHKGKEKESLENYSLMPFLDHKDSRRRELSEFENTEKVDQALKQSFLYNFLEWARAYTGVDS